MPNTPIYPKNSPPPLAPYAPGVRAGDTIYVSGVLPIGQDGACVAPGDVAGQTRYVIETIRAVLEAEDASLADIAFNQIFLRDLADYAAMNAVYAEYFGDAPPARYCIRADLVRDEFLVEIAATAYAGHGSDPKGGS